MTYNYGSNEDRLYSQDKFVEFGLFILEYADYSDSSLRGLYYDLLILIHEREELGINIMPLEDINYEHPQKIDVKKIQFAEKMQKFLILSLKNAVEKMSMKMKETDMRRKNFTYKFLAIAYFKIPEVS